MRGVVALIVLVAATMLWSPASAETPTPSPTIGPIAEDHSSTITIRNVLKGVPLLGASLSGGGIGTAYANGAACSTPVTAAITAVGIAFTTEWPWPMVWNEYPCNGIGVPVQLCDGFRTCTEPFVYDGTDATVDLEWSDAFPSSLSIPTVTGHFMYEGDPHAVTVTAVRVVGDGVTCGASTNPPVVLSDVRWLNSNIDGGPCRSVTATFTTAEYGVLETSINIPAGEDFDYYIEVPELPSAATPTAAATTTPTPAATPASLPVSGGSPSSSGVTAAALAGLGLLLAGSGAFLLRRRA